MEEPVHYSVVAPYDLWEEDEDGNKKRVAVKKGERISVLEAIKYRILPIESAEGVPPLERK